MTTQPYRILCVCLGNICRSPTAEVVLRHYVETNHLNVVVDSAGTSNYHIGDLPDYRSQAHARKRGYDLSVLRGRQLNTHDFVKFDLILAMDEANLTAIQALYDTLSDHERHQAKAKVQLMSHALNSQLMIADPYYGDAADFERVLDQCEQASQAWVDLFKRERIGC
ncbi:low molecular weight protein-tyrosine-phosphatase [Acinetobacter apis]|uniref:protein-tyrosine-phosphatase n=1 Tax=Acinetobacter apis TaxID=1229165 RepID=A0A217EDT0_9GAMM|nr:low molecular weight protein-tyrosine-phosphatase [Acinetobacter apis]SNQ28467.1 protein-tyrosine phosphatase [Acinetobacter apis]